MSEKFRHALAQLAPSPDLETVLSTYQFAAEAICGIATKNTTRNDNLIANDLIANDLGAMPATSLNLVKLTISDTVDLLPAIFFMTPMQQWPKSFQDGNNTVRNNLISQRNGGVNNKRI